ncbi:hypothetical protein [Melghirimyces algeriensis]|uniref:Uncharacterized protein n=1 Tax=Melghirimyces algeriensis TaxID=910412 RepID=A0A521F7T7_9BACL|nr:hypothetical protein [Melghirimyces algeriensis]SMO92249.1 hypothetical protein SAMN06264849_11453 [Melghirimyces algeriensis]
MVKYKHRERAIKVARGEMQDLFYTLYDRTGLDVHEDTFDNDVFTLRPFYWGDCNCGYEDREWDFFEEELPSHTEECFHTRFTVFEKELERKQISPPERDRLLTEWAIKNGYPKGRYGIAFHCDCGRKEVEDKWIAENDHLDICSVVLPNFVYKPDGLEIEWYKYPLRGAKSNKDICFEEMRAIIDHCVRSFKEANE